MGRLYGREQWNPARILRQIAAMQALFYAAYACAAAALALVSGSRATALLWGVCSAEVLDPLTTAQAWLTLAAMAAAAVSGSFALVVVVERAKKCLDFTFTVYFINFLVTCAAEGFPTTWEWWVAQILALCGMNALGEYLCMRREMADITVEDILRDRGGTMSMDLDLDLDLDLGDGTGAGTSAGSGTGSGGGGDVELGVRHGAAHSRTSPRGLAGGAPGAGTTVATGIGGRRGASGGGGARGGGSGGGRSAWDGGDGVLGAAVGGSAYSYSSPQAGRQLYRSASSSSLQRVATLGSDDRRHASGASVGGAGGGAAVSSMLGGGRLPGPDTLESSRLLGSGSGSGGGGGDVVGSAGAGAGVGGVPPSLAHVRPPAPASTYEARLAGVRGVGVGGGAGVGVGVGMHRERSRGRSAAAHR